MRFQQIFRFELAYQVRRLSTWVYLLGLFGFGFLVMRSVTPQEHVFLNGPSLIAFFTVMGGVIWQFLAAPVAGEAAARDVEARMDPLVYTTPISRIEYLGGRFAAALTVNTALLLAIQCGALLSLLLLRAAPELIGPWRPAGQVTAFLLIAWPHGFIVTAFQFAAALRQRRAIAAYLASVILAVVALPVGAILADLLDLPIVASLFDVIGFVNVMNVMAEFTPLQMNTVLLALQPMLLANRVIWILVALGAMALTYRRFQFAHAVAPRRWPALRSRTRPASAAPDPDTVRPRGVMVPDGQRSFGAATSTRQTITLAWSSFRTIARSRIGLTLVPVIALGSAFFSTEWFLFLEEIPLLPRTEEVLAFYTPGLSFPTLWVVIPLLIVFYAGELTWQQRDEGVSEIVDTAPVPEWAVFAGRFLGLSLVVSVWMGALMGAGMLIQVYLGHPQFNLALYVTALFGFQLADYLLFALLALAVHAIVDQKYLGYCAALTVYGGIVFASRLGIEHKLLIFGAAPAWSYSPMRQFGGTVAPWLWFKIYWAAWALLVAAAATLFLARGREAGWKVRLRMARHRFTRAFSGVTAAALTLVLVIGGFIFYNTNVVNAYRPAATLLERRAEYERRYGQYEGIPQPRLIRTNLRVEIYPAQRSAEVRGRYLLENRSGAPIDAIHVATGPGIETDLLGLDRPATRLVDDADLGHHAFALEAPLAPGESVHLDFAVRIGRRGFSNDGVDLAVAANGTAFKNDGLPAIGYQPMRELSSVSDRRVHGLAPRPAIPPLADATTAPEPPDRGPIDFEAVVGTDIHQMAIAPGVLRRTWTEGERRYFHYATDARIGNEYSIFSARYGVHDVQWLGPAQTVAIQLFHHPDHTRHLARMARSAQDALGYYTTHFGPYPFRHLRLIEHPGPGKGMHADANTIDYMEGFSLLNPQPDRDVDLPYHIVAHEIAHQWWGTQLAPASVEGAGLLVESLATYSAMLAGQEALGDEHLRRYLRFVRLEYQNPRSPAMPPLLRAADSFLNYRKGPLALYALGEYIGHDRIRAALRRLLQTYGPGAARLPTSLDLYRELTAVTPEPSRWLLHDLFEENTFWRLEVDSARAEQTPGGAWQVAIDVDAGKLVIDETGVEDVRPMDDWIEIGVFGGDERLHLQRHHIRSGTQTIVVTVPRQPTRAGIDPRLLLVDWETADNVANVSVR